MQYLDPPGGGRDEALNDLYDALSHDRRRIALAILADLQPPVHVETLAHRVRETEREASGDSERVDVVLHHVHLPRLAASGLLEYDPDRKEVLDVSEEAESLVADGSP